MVIVEIELTNTKARQVEAFLRERYKVTTGNLADLCKTAVLREAAAQATANADEAVASLNEKPRKGARR